jgi:formate hydrogenlyase subunit 3/multisubunit Na+/H+ antiporter MnhD subunit
MTEDETFESPTEDSAREELEQAAGTVTRSHQNALQRERDRKNAPPSTRQIVLMWLLVYGGLMVTCVGLWSLSEMPGDTLLVFPGRLMAVCVIDPLGWLALAVSTTIGFACVWRRMKKHRRDDTPMDFKWRTKLVALSIGLATLAHAVIAIVILPVIIAAL